MRDFYDLYILQQEKTVSVDLMKLRMALEATCRKRESFEVMKRGSSILEQIYRDMDMKALWENYRKKFDYAKDYTWDQVMESIQRLYEKITQ